MRTRFLAATALLVLSACSSATATPPDGHNPAHCIAAFNNAAYWFNVGQRQDLVVAMVARGIFEMEKVKSSGGSAATALAEAKSLTQAYGQDQKKMDALFVACGSAEDADPRFREEHADLLARARASGAQQLAY
jgi:hypothetical protein